MNDPKVVALIYRVEHEKSVNYERVSALRYDDDPKFHLTVEDNCARFELKEHFADKDAALEAVEPFIEQWEFETGVRWGPTRFRLRYEEAEIIDRSPSPSDRGAEKRGAIGHVFSNVIAEAKLMLDMPHYPSPPSGGSVDPKDCHVVMMKLRYDQYHLRRAKLPDVANFCVGALKKKYGDLPAAAKACGISRNVLEEIGKLSSYKGGEDSRKAEGFGNEYTDQEKRFLTEALKEIIIRAAQVAADDSQRFPQITKADLPNLESCA